MEIEMKSDIVSGSFDTKTEKLMCIPSNKYKEVDICLENKGSMHLQIFDISRTMPYEDRKKFGEELCRRWNEFKDKL